MIRPLKLTEAALAYDGWFETRWGSYAFEVEWRALARAFGDLRGGSWTSAAGRVASASAGRPPGLLWSAWTSMPGCWRWLARAFAAGSRL